MDDTREATHVRDTYEDVRALASALLPALRITTIFDVGANVGQSTRLLLQSFPDARVWAFEPVPLTFQTLSARCASIPNVTCLNIGLSSTGGDAEMVVSGRSPTNRLAPAGAREGMAHVTLKRGDTYCAEAGVPHIGYLKIDTEGHDLEVLRGLDEKIGRQAIDLIEVETGLHPANRRHVPFEAFKAHLEPRGYFLFHLREMVHEKRQARLRRCNMVFASQTVLEANARKPGAGGEAA